MPSRAFCHLANIAWLIIILIGLPSATRLKLGGLYLSTGLTGRLIFVLLASGVVANLTAALYWKRKRPVKTILLWWTFLYFALAGAQWLLLREIIGFQWLKELLLSLDKAA